MPNKERVNPIVLTIPAGIDELGSMSGNTYTLDFSRDSALAAQQSGVPLSEIGDKATIVIQKLFFFAFRKNHRSISKKQTDAYLDARGGLRTEELERLMLLYQQASYEGVICADDSELKNSELTMELT